MAKEKKISVKHYLNKKLKPNINAKDELEYPLYIRIRFDGAMTEIKSNYYAYGAKVVTMDENIRAILSEKNFNKETNQKAIRFEKNAIESLIRTLTHIYKNPVNQLLPSLYTIIANPYKNILNKVISYKLQPLIKKKDPEIHELIDWMEFNIVTFQKVIKKHFSKDFLELSIQDEDYLKQLIEIHDIIGKNINLEHTKLFLALATEKNIFELPERLIESYNKSKSEILHNYESN